jgi:hypothetical protein
VKALTLNLHQRDAHFQVCCIDSAESQRHALDLFKTLIERFANCTSTDDLLESINNIYRDADNDERLKNWFKSVDSFIR